MFIKGRDTYKRRVVGLNSQKELRARIFDILDQSFIKIKKLKRM